MTLMRYATILALSLVLACAQNSVSQGGSLADDLRAAGLRVEDAGQVEQPFFSVPAHVYRVEGGDVQVYEFPSEEVASAEAAKVAPSGMTIGTSSMHWMAPPHFFRRGRTIVNYLGDDARVLAELERLMGKQFAGR